MTPDSTRAAGRPRLFYGWYIVGAAFLANISCAFFLSSTLSVLLKPVTADLGVSRGVFSLLRSGEHLLYAAMAPWVGSKLDRYGPRGMMVTGAVLSAIGFLLLGQVQSFLQFASVRVTLMAVGHALVCYFVVNVTVARWFVRKRGRAVAISHMGHGVAKVTISLVVAWLLTSIEWRQVWTLFGGLVVVLAVVPVAIFMRRSPEDMGLHPDGDAGPERPDAAVHGQRQTVRTGGEPEPDIRWTRKEVRRTSTFWLIILVFGMVDMGITGLNLHVVAHVSDLGYTYYQAAMAMTVIAGTQLASGLLWGFTSERISVRKVISFLFVVQAAGLFVATTAQNLWALYIGFCLYGLGLGGVHVLEEVMWANYFGRLSLGTVRGAALQVVLLFGVCGPPFFGFLNDYTGSYKISLFLFMAVLLVSSMLTLTIRRPQPPGVHDTVG